MYKYGVACVRAGLSRVGALLPCSQEKGGVVLPPLLSTPFIALLNHCQLWRTAAVHKKTVRRLCTPPYRHQSYMCLN